jgi:hypothetical protein
MSRPVRPRPIIALDAKPLPQIPPMEIERPAPPLRLSERRLLSSSPRSAPVQKQNKDTAFHLEELFRENRKLRRLVRAMNDKVATRNDEIATLRSEATKYDDHHAAGYHGPLGVVVLPSITVLLRLPTHFPTGSTTAPPHKEKKGAGANGHTKSLPRPTPLVFELE